MKKFLKKLWPLALLGIFYLGLKWYRIPSVSHGQTAPDFAIATPQGDSIRLSDFKGKIVLVDFWGSWCGPCRQANKHLVEWRKKFPEDQFVILSVGIETKREAWLNAIAKDNLNWPTHGSSLQRFSEPAAQLYGVKEIPSTFLIDRDGQLIAVNAPMAQLEQTIRRKLSEN